MKNRLWIIVLLVIIGILSSACVVSATEYSYTIQDGNDNNIDYSPSSTISFNNIESDDWYYENDEDGYCWRQDLWRYIVFDNNVTVRDVVSSDERVVQADKSIDYNNVVDLVQQGGGSATVRVKVSTGDWLTFIINSCRTPFSINSTCVLSNWCYTDLTNNYAGFDSDIASYDIEDPSVIRASLGEHDSYGSWFVMLYAQKPGKTKITLTSINGDQQTVIVTIKKKAFKRSVNGSEICANTKKKVTIYTAPLAKVKLKINGKKYTLKANYKGEIKKKFSKNVVGKKCTMTVKCQGYSKTFKGKLYLY